MSTTNLLRSMFEHKAWVNAGFFEHLAKVDVDQHATERHTAIRLLNHIHVVDRIFAAHLTGRAHGYAATNTPETPTLEALRAAVRDTDAWFLDHVATLAPAQLAESIAFRFTDGERGRMTREEMLAHVLSHGSYHRGEVGQIMKRASVAPPRDLYTAYLHQAEPARRAEA